MTASMVREFQTTDRPMEILRVAQTIYPEVNGGGAYHVHAMSRDQAAMGHDVTVLTVRRDPAAPRIEERAGYTVVRCAPTATVLGNQLSAGVARYLHGADAFDVIHAHSHLYFSTNLAALKRRLADVPLAITNHGLYSQTVPKWLFEWYLRSVGRWTFNQADTVFCYTEIDERRLREFGINTEVEIVPNGIDTARFTSDGPESDRIDADGPVVLFVGRLVAGKRPQDALAAVERIRTAYPDVTLYFCGAGPMREELERRATTQPDDGVVFLGHVPYEEMPEVYRAGDVLVLPSRAEGVPRTVLEAMASGTRIVCSDLEQLSSIVDGSGAVAPVADVPAFAEKLRTQLADGATGDGGRTEPVRNGDGYDWRLTVESTTAALRRLSRS